MVSHDVVQRYKQVLHGNSRPNPRSEKRRDQSKIDSRPQNLTDQKNREERPGNARKCERGRPSRAPFSAPHPPSYAPKICDHISVHQSLSALDSPRYFQRYLAFRVFCSVPSLSPCTSKRRTFCTRKRLFLTPRIRILRPLPRHNLSPQSHHILRQKYELRPHVCMHFLPPHRNLRRNCPQRPPFRKMRVRSRSGHPRDTIEAVSRNFPEKIRREL